MPYVCPKNLPLNNAGLNTFKMLLLDNELQAQVAVRDSLSKTLTELENIALGKNFYF